MATKAELLRIVDTNESFDKLMEYNTRQQENLQKINRRKGYGRLFSNAALFAINASTGGALTPLQLALASGIGSGLTQYLGAASVKQDPMVQDKLLNKQFKEAYQQGEDARDMLVGAIPQSAASDAFSTYVLSGTDFFEDVTNKANTFLTRNATPSTSVAPPVDVISSSNLGGLTDTSGSVLADPNILRKTVNVPTAQNPEFFNPFVKPGGFASQMDFYDPSTFTQFGTRGSNIAGFGNINNPLNQAMSLTANDPRMASSFATQTIPMPDFTNYGQIR
jgi:hypothetical protein|tara:strand:+ start:212 stop:1045 length:834 start_codon:yes stop_codon:yes gene_type:complete